MPPLTDRMNTIQNNMNTSVMSMNFLSTFRQGEDKDEGVAEGGGKVPSCYLLLPWDDVELVIASINEDSD